MRGRTTIAAALLCVAPLVAVPPADAADGLGTVSGLVTVPRPGGYYGDITLYRQDAAASPVTVSTTDGGHYLATVPIGTYKVGFSVDATDDFGTTYYDDAASLAGATPVVVLDDTPTEDIDADLVIDPTKGQVNGHIATSGGALYSGNVEFYPVGSATSVGSAYAYLGDFTKVLAPGTYRYGFGLDPDDAYLPRYHPGSATLEGATPVEVTAGGTVTADATATTDPGQGVISGTVTTPDGPFTGDATFVWQGADPGSHPTLTAYVGGGTYSRTLRPGTYLVGFSLADDDGYLDQYFDGKLTPAGATLVTVGAGEQATGIDGSLEVDLEAGHVAGTVTLPGGGGFGGPVSFFRQDGDGDPVADFTAAATDGEYDRALPPGSYKVGFGVTGIDDYLPAYYDGVDSLAAATPVTIAAGATTDDIDAVLVLAPRAPARPAAPTVVRGNHAATVSWTAPDDNGSPITAYDVASVPAGVTVTVPAATTQTTVTGLTNGTGYRFTVTAVNDVGDSPASTPSALVVPAGPPARPPAPAVTRGNRSASVAWTAPDDNGSPITSYAVASVPAGINLTLPGSATSATVTGLTNGTGYRFTVTAVNDVAASPVSTPSAVVVPAGLPGRVARPKVRLRGTTATLTWRAAAAHGARVTGYVVTRTCGRQQVEVATTARRLAVRHLKPGRYIFRVVARNAVGPSTPSAAVIVRVKAGRR